MSRLFVPLEKFRKQKQSNVNQLHSQVEEETSFYYPTTRHVHFAAGKFEISQPIPTRIRCVFFSSLPGTTTICVVPFCFRFRCAYILFINTEPSAALFGATANGRQLLAMIR